MCFKSIADTVNRMDEAYVQSGDRKAGIRSRDIGFLLVILLMAAAVAWLINFSLGSWGQPIDIGRTLIEQNRTISEVMDQHGQQMEKQHAAYESEARINRYVMWACLNPYREKECRDLKMDMPDELKRMQYR